MSSHTLYTPESAPSVLAHYERAVDFIAANFPLAPVKAIEYYPGPGGRAEYTASLHHPVPDSIPTVEIGEFGHTKRYIAIAPNSLLWLVHHNAIGFASWTPSPRDPESVGFGRIIISALYGATADDLESAMLVVRSVLLDRRIECIPVLGADTTAALFIPFCDAPTYDTVPAVAPRRRRGRGSPTAGAAHDDRRPAAHARRSPLRRDERRRPHQRPTLYAGRKRSARDDHADRLGRTGHRPQRRRHGIQQRGALGQGRRLRPSRQPRSRDQPFAERRR